MSNLETDAQPILTPMINGRKTRLTKIAQRTVAAWAFKTAVIGEQITPSAARTPNEHRHWLRDHAEPPAAAFVFIAATDAKWIGDTHYGGIYMFADSSAGILPAGTPIAYGATLVIRHLALQVVAGLIEDAAFAHQAPLNASVRRIWPSIAAFEWPPGPVLTPPALDALANHWRGSGEPVEPSPTGP